MLKKYILSINFVLILIVVAACSSNPENISNNANNANNINYVSKKNITSKQLPSSADAADEIPPPDAYEAYDKPIQNQPEVPYTENIEKRSTYSTKFNVKDKARTNNITVAANSINGLILQPNEVFSYNNAVGPTIKKRGYKSARIFVNGRDSKGYGGGVCQVSSTLYNTADLFGLEIIERHPHSKEVKYVPKDRDAATSYGRVDLKFKNNQNYPVKIEAGADNGILTIDIVGLV